MEKIKSHQCFSGVTEFYKHTSDFTKTSMNFAIHRPQDLGCIKGGLIWLSGLTCNEQNFITKAGAQRMAGELNLVLICPDTSPRGLNLPGEHETYDFGSGASFYVDATTENYKDNYQMYSYINQELYEHFNKTYELGGQVGIFGHSMGGHGALTIGLKNPEKYKSISAFSPITSPMLSAWGQKTLQGYLGDDKESWRSYDTCQLLQSGKKHSSTLLVDQGLSDEFYPDQLMTDNLQKACDESGQKISLNYREGFDHSYYFVASFIEDHLKHHSNVFT